MMENVYVQFLIDTSIKALKCTFTFDSPSYIHFVHLFLVNIIVDSFGEILTSRHF